MHLFLWNFIGPILRSQHSVLWRDRLNLFAARLRERARGQSAGQVGNADTDGWCVHYKVMLDEHCPHTHPISTVFSPSSLVSISFPSHPHCYHPTLIVISILTLPHFPLHHPHIPVPIRTLLIVIISVTYYMFVTKALFVRKTRFCSP